jgi:uncharacterized protein YkwD
LRYLRALAVCSLVACTLALPPPAPAAAASPGEKLTAALNKARAKRGVPALRVSPSLRRSARRYARLMLRRDFFGHQSQISASRRFRRLGETLALHSGWRPRWRLTYRLWMRSAPHRRILLSRRFTWIGVGSARGSMGGGRDTTWVAHVGKR